MFAHSFMWQRKRERNADVNEKPSSAGNFPSCGT